MNLRMRGIRGRLMPSLFLSLILWVLPPKIWSLTIPTVVYKKVKSVLSLSHILAAQGGMAELKGVVTLSSPRGIVLQDDTGGIWVDCNNETPTVLAIGEVVTVVGEVGAGAYSPEIEHASVHPTGYGQLPKPRVTTFVSLTSGQDDAQYVAIKGVIRTVTLRNDALTTVPSEGVLLTVDMTDGRVDVALPTRSYEAASGLIGAKARIVGVALARKNDDMQQTGVLLVAQDIANVTTLEMDSTDMFSGRLISIGSLLQYGSHTDYSHRIRLRGTLIYYEQGHRLVMQDDSRAIEVIPADSPALNIGDQVEAVGFPTPEVAGPNLNDAVVRRLRTGALPTPVPVTLQEAVTSKYRSRLVSLRLRLVRVITEPTRTLFLLEQGHTLTSAELDANVALPIWLRPGSDLRVTGIDMLTVEGGNKYLNFHDATPHSVLLLRSLDDILLVSPASWWTQTHLIYLIAALAILLTSFFGLLLYVQLKRWKIESILRERERLAHDVHDTLAQSFAGVGFQLQVIRRAVATGDPNLTSHLDTAVELVRFSHREARKSLMPRALDTMGGGDLLASLREKAQALITNGEIEIVTSSSGSAQPIPRDLKMELFRIGQEAIANAIRHADPKTLAIKLEYRNDSVLLEVIDDGCGFVARGDLLGFGIRAMRKRASDISADFNLVSTPEIGTTIMVEVPLKMRTKLSSLRNVLQIPSNHPWKS